MVRLTRARNVAITEATGEISRFTANHPIFRLVGAGHSGGQSPGARDKHAIVDA